MPALREGDAPAEDRRRGDPAFHPAAAALFRSEPGQAAGGARHRPAVDLCGDAADAEGPRICPRRQEPLRSRGERAAGDGVPRALLRDATSATITPPSSRRSWTTCPAAGSTGRNCSTTSGATSSRRPARSWTRSRARSPQALDEFLAPWLYPPRADGSDPRALPAVRQRPAVACAAASSARSSPAPTIPSASYTQKFGQGGDQAQSDGPTGARRRHPAQERPLRALCRARREARLDPEGRAAGGRDCGGRGAAAVAAARDRRAPGDAASRSPRRSAATGPTSRMTANMRSSARPPRCSRPA